MGGGAEGDGRGVVKRRRRQIDGVLVKAPQALLQAAHRPGVVVDFGVRQGPVDALGAAGGAGAVKHEGARWLVRQIFRGLAGKGFFIVLKTLLGVPGHQPSAAVGGQGGQFPGDFTEVA